MELVVCVNRKLEIVEAINLDELDLFFIDKTHL